eukprot:260106-Prymnesium_polylepis.1
MPPPVACAGREAGAAVLLGEAPRVQVGGWLRRAVAGQEQGRAGVARARGPPGNRSAAPRPR